MASFTWYPNWGAGAAGNNAPTVTSLSVSSGSASGGTAVTITGTGFMVSATVTFGGAAATSVVVVSATSITCVTPAGSIGSVDVTVTNTDGQSGTLTNGFTYASSWVNTKSILTNGTSQYINFGNNEMQTYNQASSWTGWANFSSLTGYRTLVAKLPASNVGWFIFQQGNRLSFFGSGTGTLFVQGAANLSSTGTWYFWAVTLDGSSTAAGLKLYLNATEQTSYLVNNDNLTGSWANSISLTMGCDLSGGGNAAADFFSGYQTQIAHWNRVLTGAEITTLYGGGTPVDPTIQSFSSAMDHLWPLGTPNDTIAASGILDRVGSVNGTPVASPTIDNSHP